MDAQNLSRWLSHQYGLQVTSLIRLKTVTGVLCDDGSRYIWKPASPDMSLHHIWGIHQMTCALTAEGVSVAGPLLSRNGAVLTALPDGTQGYLQPWLTGRHVNIRDRQERMSTLAAIAQLHRTATKVSVGDVPALQRTTLYDKLQMKTDFLCAIWPSVQTAVPALKEFEKEIFSSVDDVLQAIQAHRSRWSGGSALSFCHRDVAPHNVLWRGNQDVSFIDFDQAGMDDPFIDVVQWSNHAVFLHGAEPGHFADVIGVYGQCHPLRSDRRQLLWRLLRFPDIFIRAASEWFRVGCPSHHQHRLVNAAQRERSRWTAWANDVENG